MLVQPTAQQQAAVGPAAHQVPASPPVIAQGVNTFSSPQENLVQQSLWLPYSCLFCWPNERFTSLWQTYPALRKENTAHKGWLATTITRGAACNGLRQVEPNHFSTGQACYFTLFFFFPSDFPRKDIYTRRCCLQGREHQRLPSRASASIAPVGLLAACSQFDPT